VFLYKLTYLLQSWITNFYSSMILYNLYKKKTKQKTNVTIMCRNDELSWTMRRTHRQTQLIIAAHNCHKSPSCLELILFINLPQCNILPFLPHFCSIKYIYKTEKVIKGFWKKSSKFTGEKASYWTFLNFSCFLIQKKGYKWQKPVKYCTVK
jgi:hypothetical protein